MNSPIIPSIELIVSQFKIPDLGVESAGYSLVYQQGSSKSVKAYGVRVLCDAGQAGEYVGGGHLRLRLLRHAKQH